MQPSTSASSESDAPSERASTSADRNRPRLLAAEAALNHALQGDYVENLRREADQFGDLFSSEDAKEGMTFVEKREPRFTGR